MSELQEVNDWIPFGLYVGIKLPKLKAIEMDYHLISRCRIEMLSEWQKQMTPTWSAVVQALVAIGMRRLATELAQKHGWLINDSYNEKKIFFVCVFWLTVVHLQFRNSSS